MPSRGLREAALNYGRGFCMGSADIVPGVSGGTIALVLGIYTRLVGSIRSGSSALGRLLRGDLAGFREWLGKVDWLLLVPLLLGILSAVFALAHVLEVALADYPVQMAALFLGLVSGSVVIAWGLLTERDGRRLAIMLAVAAAMYAVLGLRADTSGVVSTPPLWAFFLSGAVAICAMILPGISGSFILVMLGMYEAVLAAVADLDIAVITAFTLGCVVGLALFSQVLHWALENHYNTVMAVLVGLMLGSVRVLWPWPDGVGSTEVAAPDEYVAVSLLLFVVGIVIVTGITELSKRLEHLTKQDEVDELRS